MEKFSTGFKNSIPLGGKIATATSKKYSKVQNVHKLKVIVEAWKECINIMKPKYFLSLIKLSHEISTGT
jgi:hypothetical protein